MSKGFEISVNKVQFERLLDKASLAALEEIVKGFGGVRWWWVADNAIIMDATTGLLWDAKPDVGLYFVVTDSIAHLTNKKMGGSTGWRLPSVAELRAIASSGFPLLKGSNWRLLEACYWLTDSGRLDLDNWCLASGHSGSIIATLPLRSTNINLKDLLIACAEKDWTVKPHGAIDSQLSLFQGLYNTIRAHILKRSELLGATGLQAIYADLDFNSVRLPKMDLLRFTDPHQGLWEFHDAPGAAVSPRQTLTLTQQVRARNPEKDVREGYVAIDFGTSSTVVAFKEQGRDQLLRIGLADFYQTPQPKHYENPTVLEFLDIAEMLKDWQSQAYRPMVSWDTVHCSHEARASLRDNDTDTKVVGSVMERLKQWAMRGNQHAVVSITDQDKNLEYPLKPLTERDPVKGEPLKVGPDYPFDPIELYAWFLGMTINWRDRGLFLHYFMTFPVKYSSDVKRKILSSFRRGLQRSLPETLLSSPRFADFSVEERASEPAAFAASALHAYGIEPTTEGEAYAVFDFGGGTTDFDYGFYRLPTEEEEHEGAEHVLEHFSAEGDEFLGGENLLENMAYRVFLDNISYFLDLSKEGQQDRNIRKVVFTKPLDAKDFPGSEMWIVRGQHAITNTTILMSKLRPLWEKGERNSNSAGTLKIKLLDRNGKGVDCDLKLDEAKLLDYLHERIRLGMKNFFVAMKQAFTTHGKKGMPQEVHILLAGNACHSGIVQAMFGIHPDPENEEAKALHELALADLAGVFGQDFPDFAIHPPLVNDAQNPYKPNAKTGVALGLLHLCPGETLHEINHASQSTGDGAESPFQFYVGGYVRNLFQVRLKRGAPYGGEWQELGVVRDRLFNMAYTQAANALDNTLPRGDLQLTERRLQFPAAENGHKVFAHAASPNTLELCTAVDIAAVRDGRGAHLQTVTLGTS